jgi:sec-independent protein translocase protein TatA
MGWDAPWHWIVLAIVVIALFGYKKLPDAARSVGRSLRVFKTEMKGMGEDDKAREAASEPKQLEQPAPPQAVVAPVVPVVQSAQPVQSPAPAASPANVNGASAGAPAGSASVPPASE